MSGGFFGVVVIIFYSICCSFEPIFCCLLTVCFNFDYVLLLFFAIFLLNFKISQTTLVYGTSNAGATIHDGSAAPEFMQNIRKAAKCLNLVRNQIFLM